jgi:N-carbamoyl-L-amino-acid hydrolase
VFRVEPGAVNSIPCGALLEIDLRDTQSATRDAALERIERAVAEICARRGMACELTRLNADLPAHCDAGLVDLALAVCAELNRPAQRMISRAYHDALFMAQLCPTTMLFIPCRGGVSHRPDEYASPEHIAAGVEVLAHTLARLCTEHVSETR